MLAGTLVAMQAPTNALVARPLGTPIRGALVSFGVGTIILATVALATGLKFDLSQLRQLPIYAWLGALYGAIFGVVMTFSAPRIGIAATIMAVLVGQLATAMILDHFGLLGLGRIPVIPQRLLAVADHWRHLHREG